MVARVAPSRWQTVEDGAPRDAVDNVLMHEGHVTEHRLIIIPVRDPKTFAMSPIHLVLRASLVTGEITACCEWVNEEDGA